MINLNKKSFLATPIQATEACREDYEGKDREKKRGQP